MHVLTLSKQTTRKVEDPHREEKPKTRGVYPKLPLSSQMLTSGSLAGITKTGDENLPP